MATTFANIGGVADPRSGDEPDYIGSSKDTPTHAPAQSDQRRHSLIYTDSSIQFEEYHWWANKSREYEKTLSTSGAGLQGVAKMLIGKKTKTETKGEDTWGVPAHEKTNTKDAGLVQPKPEAQKVAEQIGNGLNEKSSGESSPGLDQYGITNDEWYNAQRAVRTATWGSVFYLITTDILGPYSVPWAISQMGYGPGAGLYISFGLLAAYSGIQLWKMFCGLDSTKYPLRNYGDLAFRVCRCKKCRRVTSRC